MWYSVIASGTSAMSGKPKNTRFHWLGHPVTLAGSESGSYAPVAGGVLQFSMAERVLPVAIVTN